ncbi:Protein kinase domain-containing protein [Mycena kentingensis (nom. inval.)]|nr:Protein kinase domain-containing protein [Mycena kentingensis (nom. inval.)]
MGSFFGEAEDAIIIIWYVIDAIRLCDGSKVVIKLVRDAELEILELLNSTSRRADPRNHTLPVLDKIPLPDDSRTDGVLFVFPFGREFDSPPFHCRWEFVEAFSQYLEGLEFLHENGICHGDIAPKNMLVDQSKFVPRGSHFAAQLTHAGVKGFFRWKRRCGQSPNEYYFIDFDQSTIHYTENAREIVRCAVIYPRYPIPEASMTVPFNPFLVDVFQLGLVMQKIINNYPALEIFRAVVDDMLLPDPTARPRPATSLVHLQKIASTIPGWKAKLPIWSKGGGTFRMMQRIVLVKLVVITLVRGRRKTLTCACLNRLHGATHILI